MKGCKSLPIVVGVDPGLFEQYHPAVIPAIAYVRNVKINDPGFSEGVDNNAPALDDNNYFMVYGDASLAYSLEFINREAGAASLAGIVKLLGR